MSNLAGHEHGDRPMMTPDTDIHDDGAEEVEVEIVEPTIHAAEMVRVPPVWAVRLRPSYDPDALPRPLDPRLVVLDDPTSTRAANFRVLRDMLVGKGLPHVAAVSSASPGDGKTTCVVNLALALAEQPGTRVLVVDGNVLTPELGAMFRIQTMRRVVEPDSSLAPYRVVQIMHSLHVCAIPWRRGDVAPRVEQHRFDAMLRQLCHMTYDYILIDTPALRATAATAPILSVAGGTLLVARSGETTGRDLRRAAEQIPPNKRLGIALVDAEAVD